MTSFVAKEISKRKISQTPSKPFFLFLHFNSSHWPYEPPKSFLNKYTKEIPFNGETSLEVVREKYDDIFELIAEGTDLTDKEWSAVTAMYDAVLRHVDYCTKKLVNWIRKETDDQTVFAITGDHGDLLGEYGLVGHKLALHDALIHVPLVTFGVDGISDQTDEVVQHIDVVKTILSQSGIEHPQLEGINLKRDTRKTAVTQRSGKNAQKNLSKIKKYNPEYESPTYVDTLTSFRTKKFKLLYSDGGTEFFELPDEKTDVKDRYPDKYESMCSEASEWTKQNPTTSSSNSKDLSPEIKEHLSDMGYVI